MNDEHISELQELAPDWWLGRFRDLSGGSLVDLSLSRPNLAAPNAHEQLAAVLKHPQCRGLRHLSVGARFEEDTTQICSEIARNLPSDLVSLFFSGRRFLGEPFIESARRPVWLGTWTKDSTFAPAPFRDVRHLDLRDERVVCAGASFPQLEVLALRPRGVNCDWVEPLLKDQSTFPAIREVWVCEHHGDELLKHLLESPLLPTLRRLNLSGSITNRGAKLLLERADDVDSVEVIMLGDDGRRRHDWIELAEPGSEEPKIGTLEIDDGWRTKLRHRFGRRVSFELPPFFPNLTPDMPLPDFWIN